jgi:hypothetical protein
MPLAVLLIVHQAWGADCRCPFPAGMVDKQSPYMDGADIGPDH